MLMIPMRMNFLGEGEGDFPLPICYNTCDGFGQLGPASPLDPRQSHPALSPTPTAASVAQGLPGQAGPMPSHSSAAAAAIPHQRQPSGST